MKVSIKSTFVPIFRAVRHLILSKKKRDLGMVCQNITNKEGPNAVCELADLQFYGQNAFFFFFCRRTAHATVIKQDEHAVAICMSCVVDNVKNKCR